MYVTYSDLFQLLMQFSEFIVSVITLTLFVVQMKKK